MNNKVYEEEKKYLEKVNQIIENELQTLNKKLEEMKKQRISYNDAKRGEQFTKEALMEMHATRIAKLIRSVNSPYFGRFDFTPNDTLEKNNIYIGKTSVFDENKKMIVTDWRSPISSLYYDSYVGEASYVAPQKVIEGEISLKRQFIIENAILQKIIDTDVIIDDEILFNYLNTHADDKMKNIVASIQKEQNEIIRKPLNENIIVQGIAGSGKTSVALHRIAYLMYLLNSDEKKISSNRFLVIGPNDYFLDYVSGVLPDLDIENISQTTLNNMVLDLINEKVTILDSSLELEEYYTKRKTKNTSIIKNSQEFELAIDKYLEELVNWYRENDIIAYDKVIFTKEQISTLIGDINGGNIRTKIDAIQKILIKKIKDDYDKYIDILVEDMKKEALSYPAGNPIRNLIFEKMILIENDTKKGLPKIINSHFEKITKKVIKHYSDFINNIEKYINIENPEILKKETLKNISKKKLSHDDIAPILYLKSKLDKINNYDKILHVVVDEAQDLGILDFKMLKRLMPNATFSIFGDLNQSIYSYRSIKNWESVNETIFNGNGKIVLMEQSYRTTQEIMKEANKISSHLTGTISKDIIRHGNNVQYISSNDTNSINFIIECLDKYIKKEYKTIAIICKTEKEALTINKKLSEMGVSIRNVCSNDKEYYGGICTISCGLAKGLEFDATILINVETENYNPDYEIDMKLLYVGMTRALHETHIISCGELPWILSEEKQMVKKMCKN